MKYPVIAALVRLKVITRDTEGEMSPGKIKLEKVETEFARMMMEPDGGEGQLCSEVSSRKVDKIQKPKKNARPPTDTTDMVNAVFDSV